MRSSLLFAREFEQAVPLFVDPGLRFLDHAKALQNQWHEATRAVESAGAYERSMRLGIQHDVSEIFAGAWLSAIRTDDPSGATSHSRATTKPSG